MTRTAGTNGISGRAARLVDRHRATVLAAGSVYLALVSVAPVATTPYRSDDIVNRTVPDRYADSGLSLIGFVIEWIGPWITREGRFFPGSATWTVAVFTTLRSREEYKVFVAALVLLMIALAAVVVAVLTRSSTAPVVVVGLTSTLTLRTWFDGLDSFSGILPLTVCLSLGSLLLLLRGRGSPSALVGCALWAYALVTYEVAILFTPTLAAVVWWYRRRWTRTLPLLVPAIAIAIIVTVLRAQASGSTGNAYRINLEPWRVLVTYVKQAGAALPLSEQWFPGGEGLEVSGGLVVVTTLLVAVPAGLVLVLLARGDVHASLSAVGVTAFVGASLWLLPPLLVAVSLGWQNELPRGQGYVSVVWGYVGVAMLAAAAWIALARTTGGPPSTARRLVLSGLTGVLAVLAGLTVAQNITIAVLTQSGSA